MRLHSGAIYFDRETVYDGYNGIALFKGQVRNFNDASSTGATLRRRVLSVAPGLTVPLRRCVQLGDLHWIAGIGLTDTFQGKPIRLTYNLRVGSNLFEILAPAAACTAGAALATAYGYEEFFKDSGDNQTSSSLDTFWNIFFAPVEPVKAGSFLRVGTRMLRVRQAYATAEELRIAEADELDEDWSQAAVFTNLGTYDPIFDTYPTTTTSVPVIQMDIFKFFRWRVEAEAQKQPGDKTVFVPKTVTPKTGATFTMNGGTWRVLAVQPEQDIWALHARPA